MVWVKIQRQAKNRMKDSTGLLCEKQIGMMRFIGSYYSNFLIGMVASLLGARKVR